MFSTPNFIFNNTHQMFLRFFMKFKRTLLCLLLSVSSSTLPSESVRNCFSSLKKTAYTWTSYLAHKLASPANESDYFNRCFCASMGLATFMIDPENPSLNALLVGSIGAFYLEHQIYLRKVNAPKYQEKEAGKKYVFSPGPSTRQNNPPLLERKKNKADNEHWRMKKQWHNIATSVSSDMKIYSTKYNNVTEVPWSNALYLLHSLLALRRSNQWTLQNIWASP